MSVEQTQQTMDLHFEGLESDAFSQYFVDDVTWKAIAPTAWRPIAGADSLGIIEARQRTV